jgi:hypothetical protein
MNSAGRLGRGRPADVTGLLYRYSGPTFLMIVGAVFWAFWPIYFSVPPGRSPVTLHAHALSWTLWCLLLVVQGLAVRQGSTRLHQRLGALSPLLAAAIVLGTLAFMRDRARGAWIGEPYLITTAFNLATLGAFITLYGLAMYHRRDRALHSRYMICTALPLFPAFVPRLITVAPPWVGETAMRLFGRFAALGQAALVPADIAVLGLVVLDWRAQRRTAVFPIALALLLAIHGATVFLYRVPAWRSAVEWLAGAT